MTRAEQEMTIIWDMERKMVTMYTSIPSQITKCKKLGFEVVSEDRQNGKIVAMTFETPLEDFAYGKKRRIKRKTPLSEGIIRF